MWKVSSDAYVELTDAAKIPEPDAAEVWCCGWSKILDQVKS